jgi:hypothetical protein
MKLLAYQPYWDNGSDVSIKNGSLVLERKLGWALQG